MKRLLMLLALASLPALAQTKINPDCDIQFSLTGAGSSATTGCAQNLQGVRNWTLTYQSVGFSGLTLTVQEAPDGGGTPGSWSTFTAATGSNPATSTTGVGADATFTGYAPWVRVTLSGLTGSGTVTGHLYGCRNPGCGASASSAGSGCTAAGGAGTVQASNGSGACQATSVVDNGSTVSTTEPVVTTQSVQAGSTVGGGKDGAFWWKGHTSGSQAFAVADVAGTAITLILPTTNPTSGQVLADNGSTTCPTNLPAGLPATCHQLIWNTSTAGNYQTVQNNGTPLTQRPVLNFTTNVTCTDDAGNTLTDCAASSSGGGSGLPICTAAGGSGTAYTCTTSPTFVPSTGVAIAFKSDVVSGSAPTLNVNASAADGLFKIGGQQAIAGGDLCAGAWNVAIFDASSHWEITSPLCNQFPPAIGSWTQILFPAGSAANTTFGPLFIQPPNTNAYMILSTPQPSTPYTLDVAISQSFGNTGSSFAFGWLESSTQKITLFGGTGTQLYACNNNTSYTNTVGSGCGTSGTLSTPSSSDRIQHVRLQDTGTVLRVFLSADGLTWQQYGTDVNVNTFFTTAPDSIIFGAFGGNGSTTLSSGYTLASYYAH